MAPADAPPPSGPPPTDERFDRVGMVARWKPFHLGQRAVLRGLCDRADRVIVGLGSSNAFDVRNPWTAGESRAMIRRALDGDRLARVEFVEVPDLGDGPRWRAMVADLCGDLDAFVTANGYVRDLMAEVYRIIHPVRFVEREARVPVTGTMVRRAMARGGAWEEMVPPEVAAWMREEGLVERFVAEFGRETLARAEGDDRAEATS